MSNGLQYMRSIQIDVMKNSLSEPLYRVHSLLNQIRKEIEWNEKYAPEGGDYFEGLTRLHQMLAMAKSSMEITAHLLDEAVLISEGDKTALPK